MVTLRLAEPARDGAHLLAWRNDPAARAASPSDRVITPEEHARWLETTADVTRIAEVDGQAIGVVRITPDTETTGVVSIVIEATRRGQGCGTAALRALLERERALGVRRLLTARIAADNHASQAAFARAGFSRVGRTLMACWL